MGVPDKYSDDKHMILNINKHVNTNLGYKKNKSITTQCFNDRFIQKPTYPDREEKDATHNRSCNN